MDKSLLRVLDAARLVTDDMQHWLDNAPGRIPEGAHLREAMLSVPANIREGIGRKTLKQRVQYFGIANGSVEEADERLRANFAGGYISARDYWRMHNRLVVVAKMLTSLIAHARDFDTDVDGFQPAFRSRG